MIEELALPSKEDVSVFPPVLGIRVLSILRGLCCCFDFWWGCRALLSMSFSSLGGVFVYEDNGGQLLLRTVVVDGKKKGGGVLGNGVRVKGRKA